MSHVLPMTNKALEDIPANNLYEKLKQHTFKIILTQKWKKTKIVIEISVSEKVYISYTEK